ncbi:hypothetical protein EJB05_14604, partial [Eragrostis curvula]
MVERMFKVAFWCVQEQPEARPPIGVVVKMLEGEMDIAPPVNPFHHLMAPRSFGDYAVDDDNDKWRGHSHGARRHLFGVS